MRSEKGWKRKKMCLKAASYLKLFKNGTQMKIGYNGNETRMKP
jgi:hypothetical protein